MHILCMSHYARDFSLAIFNETLFNQGQLPFHKSLKIFNPYLNPLLHSISIINLYNRHYQTFQMTQNLMTYPSSSIIPLHEYQY